MEFSKLTPICESCKDKTKKVYTPTDDDRALLQCTKCTAVCFTRQINFIDVDNAEEHVSCEKCGCKDGKTWYDFDNIRIYCSECGSKMFEGWLQGMEIDPPETQPEMNCSPDDRDKLS